MNPCNFCRSYSAGYCWKTKFNFVFCTNFGCYIYSRENCLVRICLYANSPDTGSRYIEI